METTNTIPESLEGKRVVLTGTFNFDRDHLKDLLIAEGALVYGSVARSTDIVFVGGDQGSNPGRKLQKAKEFGTQVWAEAELVLFLRKKGHIPRPRLSLRNVRLSFPHITPPDFKEDDLVWPKIPKVPGDLYNYDRHQIKELGRRYTLPDMAQFVAPDNDHLARTISSVREHVRTQVDDAVANAIVTIMLQLGLTTLSIDDAIRSKVAAGNYLLNADKCHSSVNFTYDEIGDDLDV